MVMSLGEKTRTGKSHFHSIKLGDMLAASMLMLSADCDAWLGTVCQTFPFEVALLPSSEGSHSALPAEGGGEVPPLNHTCCVGLYKGLAFLLSSS